MTAPMLPDFRAPEFLRVHIRDTMAFYHPHCIAPDGGFFQYFKDDGTIYDRRTRHLVSSTRFVFNYAMAYIHFGDAAYREAARHGIDYLRRAHRNADSGGYAWMLDGRAVLDTTNHCYGLAFVLLAYAKAIAAGLPESRTYLDEAWALLERRFWDREYGLYMDAADGRWNMSAYRGQNANMHVCEALIAAHEATGEWRFLERAARIADHMVNRQAALAGGWIWEHYHADWSVDWDYNRGDFANIYRPWGFQPGHQVEWAKLLLILDRHAHQGWRLGRARALFDRALAYGWDRVHGGLVYGLDTDFGVYDADKYFWVQAEAIAAAALLADRTGNERYWRWYERLWEYSWRHFVDHRYGAWYRILTPDNRRYSDEKSPAGKVDYHTMGACYDVLTRVGPAP